jgi:hypothetical protein
MRIRTALIPEARAMAGAPFTRGAAEKLLRALAAGDVAAALEAEFE